LKLKWRVVKNAGPRSRAVTLLVNEHTVDDWVGSYDELVFELEKVLDLGDAVTFAAVRQDGRPLGSSGRVQLRYAAWGMFALCLHLGLVS